MLRVSQVNQSIDEPMERLHQRICKKLRIRERDLIRFSIYRESVDAKSSSQLLNYGTAFANVTSFIFYQSLNEL